MEAVTFTWRCLTMNEKMNYSVLMNMGEHYATAAVNLCNFEKKEDSWIFYAFILTDALINVLILSRISSGSDCLWLLFFPCATS